LQAELDAWHRAHPGPIADPAAYRNFLEGIGYLLPQPATVRATTVVARAPSEDFRALAPYTLAIVQLDEGPRLMGHAAAGVQIGERVRAEFFEHLGRPLLRFVPDEATPP
uniref:Zn-ribbon domain-containing OB-fold protein n=1 Tax=Diaphorobacter nitroreducens TaxID=164759 RepID=UPI0028B140D7